MNNEIFWRRLGAVYAATLLLDAGYAGFSTSRSYFAMFYVAEALLLGKDLSFSKYSAVIAKLLSAVLSVNVHFFRATLSP